MILIIWYFSYLTNPFCCNLIFICFFSTEDRAKKMVKNVKKKTNEYNSIISTKGRLDLSPLMPFIENTIFICVHFKAGACLWTLSTNMILHLCLWICGTKFLIKNMVFWNSFVRASSSVFDLLSFFILVPSWQESCALRILSWSHLKPQHRHFTKLMYNQPCACLTATCNWDQVSIQCFAEGLNIDNSGFKSQKYW